MMKSGKICWTTWFSGFFATAAVMHALRLISHTSLVIGSREVPMRVSVIVSVVAMTLSVALLVVSCKKSCCDAPHQ